MNAPIGAALKMSAAVEAPTRKRMGFFMTGILFG